MKSKISNQFMMNYIMVFFLSMLAAVFAFLLLSFANDVISKTLVKNIYPASLIMQDDYTCIDPSPVVQNGGGVQIVNEQYKVVSSAGLNTLGEKQLSAGEFTDFLTQSKSKGVLYHYDISYNPKGKFWLIVTFPASIRLDFSFVYNKEAASRDMKNVAGAFVAVALFYLLLLAVFAIIFSRITSVRITAPLRKLREGTKRLREGDYSARVALNLKNEFAELQDTFNEMAGRIEREIALRKQSEEDRKKLILDVSHDLKNPLSSIVGYTELCLKEVESLGNEQVSYLQIILKNSHRASQLLYELFELSKLESPEFALKTDETDICEFLRQSCGDLLPALERAGFEYNFEIPDSTILTRIDTVQLSRVFHNLVDNAIRYNCKGTVVSIRLIEKAEEVTIMFMDDGIGIPNEAAKDIFKPFVRVDDARNSETGGSGLGLSIAYKIVKAHGGKLGLNTDVDKGCTFFITLPRI